jgi:hypothetical protein
MTLRHLAACGRVLDPCSLSNPCMYMEQLLSPLVHSLHRPASNELHLQHGR